MFPVDIELAENDLASGSLADREISFPGDYPRDKAFHRSESVRDSHYQYLDTHIQIGSR
jgi:hypothetical protein